MHTGQEERVTPSRFLRRSSIGTGFYASTIWLPGEDNRQFWCCWPEARSQVRKSRRRRLGDSMYKLNIKLLMTAAVIFSLLLTVRSFAASQIRIVRMSDVHGDVQIDRNTGQGYEKAFLNFPLTQGVKIQTKQDGRGEVEFEDGSALPSITPDTVIEFPQLSLGERIHQSEP